jgi:hypothetical protein
MNTAVVKASKAVKGITSTVRSHLDAVERAREIYLAQIKRAEADYFDRITRATEIITGEPAAPEASAPTAQTEATPS